MVVLKFAEIVDEDKLLRYVVFQFGASEVDAPVIVDCFLERLEQEAGDVNLQRLFNDALRDFKEGKAPARRFRIQGRVGTLGKINGGEYV